MTYNAPTYLMLLAAMAAEEVRTCTTELSAIAQDVDPTPVPYFA